MSETQDQNLLPEIRQIARRAGAETLRFFRHKELEAMEKADGSPVTAADEASEAIILEGLKALTPDIPIVAEESAAAGDIPDIGKDPYWLVDPLDGTKEFITGSGEYTINIALIREGVPVMGVVYVPAHGEMYSGLVGQGAWLEYDDPDRDGGPISVRGVPEAGLTVVSSRRHGDTERLAILLGDMKVAEEINCGSSVKFCQIAAGRADFYPRLGPTCEWDIAAGHAVLRAAGGDVCQVDGSPMPYGKIDQKFLNPEFLAYAERPASLA